MMLNGIQSLSVVVLMVLAFVTEVESSDITYGEEAERLCQAYKKVCPRGKVCAIQVLAWSHSVQFPVCVHTANQPARSRDCEEAPSPGEGCGFRFRRWYYNVHVAACSWFTYSGCGGNSNNFPSREECEKACHPSAPHEQHISSDEDDVTSGERHHDHDTPRHQGPQRHSHKQLAIQGDFYNSTSQQSFNRPNELEPVESTKPSNGQFSLNVSDTSPDQDISGRSYIDISTAQTTQSSLTSTENNENKNQSGREMGTVPTQANAVRFPKEKRTTKFTGAAERQLSEITEGTRLRTTIDKDEHGPFSKHAGKILVNLTSKKKGDFGRGSNRHYRKDDNSPVRSAQTSLISEIKDGNIPGEKKKSVSRSRAARLIHNRPGPSDVNGNDVTSNVVTSSLSSSYAAVGNDTVREFPTRISSSKTRGKSEDKNNSKQHRGRRRRKRRRRRNRQKGRRNRRERRKRRKSADAVVTAVVSYNVNDSYNSINNSENGQALSREDTPTGTPSLEIPEQEKVEQSLHRNETKGLTEEKEEEETQKLKNRKERTEDRKLRRRKRRRRRRKKGRGRKRRRGRGRKRERGPRKEETEKGSDLPAPETTRGYYETIHLFGILDRANATEDLME